MRSLSLLSLLSLLSAPVSAQTDPTGDWRTWKTAHFRVYARVQDSTVARAATAEAERSYALLASELVPPSGPIELLLNDNVDFSNGFTGVSPLNRIAIFLAPPAADAELGQYDSWLRIVITHELAHVFHLDRARGVWSLGRALFGRNSWFFPNGNEPEWITEGLAVYYESRFSNSGRERGGYHGQLLAARELAGAWPEPNDAVFNSVRWPAGQGRYAFGSRFLELEAATHGDSVIPKFVENTAGQLLSGLVSNPLEGAGGEGVPEGWRRLEQHTAPRGDSDRVLLHGLRTEPRLTMSPDRTRLAYVRSDGRSAPRVVVLDQSGHELRSHLTTGETDLAWLGDTVVVSQLEFDTPAREWSDLYRWAPDGDWTRLTHGARLVTPFAWDGRPAAMQVSRDTRTPVTLEHAALVGVPVPAAESWGQIEASPDGRMTAGVLLRDGRWDVALWPRDSAGAVRMLTSDQAVDAEVAWSRDGSWLLFASERAGLGQIYAYHVAEQRLVRLTDAAAGAREPALDANGTLFYTTQREDGFAIVTRDSALQRPYPVEAAAPPAAFAAATPVQSTVSSYAEWWALVPRYWRPVDDNVGSGSGHFYGAHTSASDALGRMAYTAEAYASPTSWRWEAYLGTSFSRWRSFSVDAAVSQFWGPGGVLTLSNGTDTTYATRDRSATAGVTWRARNWRSSVALRAAAIFTNHGYQSDGPPVALADKNYAGGTVSLTLSRAQANALSQSLEDGATLAASFTRRYELHASGVRDVAVGSLNSYLGLPLPGFSHWTLAGRVVGGWSGNNDPAFFGIGGESGDVYQVVQGVTLGDGRRTFPLRGYPPSGGLYTRALTGVMELRIPLVLVGHGLWRWPVGLDRVGLSLFGEAGGGFDASANTVKAPEVIRSDWPTQFVDAGGELVVDVTGGFFNVRVRGGLGVPLRDGLGVAAGHVRPYFAFGTSF